jgi:polysaccharide chain length determinant protein (PEP-CTERM system associated)
MEQARNNLEESKLSLREAEKRQAATDKELTNIIQVLKSSGREVQIITPYDERISDLHRELDKMLLNYTDQHPDVVALRRVLKNLLKKQQDTLVELQSEEHSTKNNLELNPVYQELKINLGTAIADVESLKVRVTEHKQRYEKLQRLVNTIPEIEAQLTALNRDYNITKSKYEEFLDRRESASISESVDQTTESIQFKVIESPRVENIPVGPKRILLSSAVLLISLSLGVGFAFLLSQLKPVVMSSKQMIEVTNLPVLGTVSAVVSPAQRRRRFLLIFSYLSLLIALFVIFGLLMGWYIIAN